MILEFEKLGVKKLLKLLSINMNVHLKKKKCLQQRFSKLFCGIEIKTSK